MEIASHVMLLNVTRVLFGPELCRDPELNDLFAQYGIAVVTSGMYISRFPRLLRP